MTSLTKKHLSLFAISSALLLVFARNAGADVDGDIGVIGFSPTHIFKSSVGKPQDMTAIEFAPGLIGLVDELKHKLPEEVPAESLATAGSDTLRLYFDLIGPTGAPFMLVAIPADVEVDSIDDLRDALAVSVSRFDGKGTAKFGFTVSGTPKQLDAVKFIMLAIVPEGPDDRPDEDDAQNQEQGQDQDAGNTSAQQDVAHARP